jgi:hypothetical protein
LEERRGFEESIVGRFRLVDEATKGQDRTGFISFYDVHDHITARSGSDFITRRFP